VAFLIAEKPSEIEAMKLNPAGAIEGQRARER
jgi:hypothetical protein